MKEALGRASGIEEMWQINNWPITSPFYQVPYPLHSEHQSYLARPHFSDVVSTREDVAD